MKVVINACFGGFGLSDAAYERLIELGIPVSGYVEQRRGPNGLYLPESANAGEVIFDRRLEEGTEIGKALRRLTGNRYWETWLDTSRTHPLLIRVIEELGEKANGSFASLKIVEIPDGVDWEIDEYDGKEQVAETHRTWA